MLLKLQYSTDAKNTLVREYSWFLPDDAEVKKAVATVQIILVRLQSVLLSGTAKIADYAVIINTTCGFRTWRNKNKPRRVDLL